MPQKPTYWVRSRNNNEASRFARHPVPARFNTLEKAEQYRRQLNLLRGPYHPGYVVEKQDDALPPAVLLK